MRTVSSVYTAPAPFLERLEEVFQGRLRLRWSLQYRAWIIEQKVGNASLPPIHPDPYRDDLIQACDGYAVVMRVQPGDRMACEFCHLSLKVPVKEIKEVPCDYCLARGRDARFVACYWPLDETLIDHLISIDPERRGGREMRARIMADLAKNDGRIVALDKDAAADREAVGKYYFPQMFQIQSVGWTPTVKRKTNACSLC